MKKLLKAPYLTNLMLAIVALELWFLIRTVESQPATPNGTEMPGVLMDGALRLAVHAAADDLY